MRQRPVSPGLSMRKTQAWGLAVLRGKNIQVDASRGLDERSKATFEGCAAKNIGASPAELFRSIFFFASKKPRVLMRPEDTETIPAKKHGAQAPGCRCRPAADRYRAARPCRGIAEQKDFWWRDFLRNPKPRDLKAVSRVGQAALSNEQGKA